MSKFDLKNPVHFLALGFGSGLLKPAPGTWGTLAALPIAWWVANTLATNGVAYSIFCVASFLIGIYLCGQTARDVGEHDHGSIVWDEFVGLFVTLLFVPVTGLTLLVAFLLFRVFDIIKPWPISWLDKRVHGGLGIMIDDVLAGLFACMTIHLLISLGVFNLCTSI